MNAIQRYFYSTLRPAAYHGVGKRPPFFEGWYLKVVDAAGQRPLALIPGVFYGKSAKKTHAFVMILDGANNAFHRFTFPTSHYWASEAEFAVAIGDNRFSAESVTLNLPGFSGTLTFSDVTPWPVTPLRPGVMGWYAWVPLMQTFHGILSFDHAVSGSLHIDDKPVSYSGGRGYIEKDWGHSFPKTWIWLQSNHFNTPNACLTASTAMIPWVTGAFRGFIIGFWHRGVLYPFATYTGATTVSLDASASAVEWVVRDKRYQLTMRAARQESVLLWGPTPEGMVPLVEETVSAEIHVRLETLGGEVIFDDVGQHTGMEVHGDIQQLLSLKA